MAPCQYVLDVLQGHWLEIDRQLAELQHRRASLNRLLREGERLPLDDVRGERCVCHLIETCRNSSEV